MIIGYARVSSVSQKEDRQIDELLNYGIKIRNIYVDKQSGKDFYRPNYIRMYKKLKKDDLLVIKSIDRLCRSHKCRRTACYDAGTKYRYSSEKGSGLNYLWLHFTGYGAEKTVEEASVPLNKICFCGNIGSVIECWKRICTEFILNDEHFEEATTSILKEILIAFSGEVNNKRKKQIVNE